MAEEREAKVRLDVEKTGDTDAFGETTQQVEELNQALDAVDTSESLDEFGSLEDQMKSLGSVLAEVSTQQAVEQFGNLGDAADDLSTDLEEVETKASEVAPAMDEVATSAQNVAPPLNQQGASWGELANKMAVGMTAFRSAQRLLEELVDASNKVTESLGGTGDELQILGGVIPFPKHALDQFVQAITDANLHLQEHTGKLQDSIDAYEEAQRAYFAVRDAKRADADATAELNEKTREFVEGLGLSVAALREQAQQLEQNIANALKLDPDIDPDALAAKIEPLVRRLVEQFEAAGAEIDPALQRIIDKFGLLAPAVEESASRQEAALQGLGAAMDGAGESTDQLYDRSVRIVESFDEFGNKIITVTDDARPLGQVLSEAARGADELGGGVSRASGSIAQLGPNVARMASDSHAAAGAMQSLGTQAEAAAAPIEQTAQSAEQLAQSQAAGEADALAAALGGLVTAGVPVVTMFGNLIKLVRDDFGSLSGFEAPILTGLRAIVSESEEAAAAIERVVAAAEGAGGGGGAPGPGN